MPKYIFVTGGVLSGVGKGIVTASIGRILKSRGLRVSILKLDPYINVDPGTMSPYQHGEVFVTDDGAETDLDLGHYERFLDENFTQANSTSSGQVYEEVIRKERRGDFLGGTIQAIPHVTREITGPHPRRRPDAGRGDRDRGGRGHRRRHGGAALPGGDQSDASRAGAHGDDGGARGRCCPI